MIEMPKIFSEYKDYVRSKIIDAAIKIFEMKGYHNSTMLNISQRIQMSKSSIYSYFKNKEEILKSIVITINQTLGKLFQDSFNGVNLATAAKSTFEKISIENCPHLSINLEILSIASRDNYIKQVAKEDREKGIIAIESTLQNQMNVNLIPKKKDIHLLSQLVLGHCWNLIIQLLLGYDKNLIRDTWTNSLIQIMSS